jgi:hypothetical protein
MTALDFPANPTNGQEYNGYIWNATKGVWDSNSGLDFNITDLADVDTTGVVDGNALVYDGVNFQWVPGAGGGGGGSYTISDTPPTNPSSGDVWFSSSDGRSYIYYVDEDSSQWIEVGGIEGPQGPPGQQGVPGTDGIDGDSGYQVAIDNGFVGTEAQWLASLVGPQGPQGIQGVQGEAGPQGETGPAGPAGADGADGTNGVDGDSGYQVAVDNGFVGTEAQLLASLVGPQGPTGPQGETGPQGDPGQGLSDGGTTGQFLIKTSDTDYDTEWTTLTVSTTLDELTDVDTSGVADGQTLIYDQENSQWIPGEGGSQFVVSDTAPTNPENGDTWFKSDTGKTYIYYVDADNGQWVEIASNTTGYLDIGQLNDVTIVSPTTGQALTYDGSGWVNATPASTLDSLTDVDPSAAVDGQALIYDGANSEWIPGQAATAVDDVSLIIAGRMFG